MVQGRSTALFDMNKLERINIIEGPPQVGRSTYIQTLQSHAKACDIDMRLIELPHHDSVAYLMPDHSVSQDQQLIFSLPTLFCLMDQIVEEQIVPHLKDDQVIFVMDTFLPSLCVQQQLSLDIIHDIFCDDLFRNFSHIFSQAHYTYLERTCRDIPDMNVVYQYDVIQEAHRANGILGSHHVKCVSL